MSVLAQSGLSLDRLETFLSVVATGSLKQAAGGDPVRASQFSRQIKQLEDALGTPLFLRGGRRWSLTEAGEELARSTRRYFLTIESLGESARARARVIRIGAGSAFLEWYLTPVLPFIAEAVGGIHYSLESLRTRDVLRQLNDGQIDVGFLRKDAVEDSFVSELVATISYSLFVPRALLPDRNPAGLEYLGTLPFGRIRGGGAFAGQVEEICEIMKLRTRTAMEADLFTNLVHAVRSSWLAAFLPHKASAEFSTETISEISHPEFARLDREIVMVTDPNSGNYREEVERFCEELAVANLG